MWHIVFLILYSFLVVRLPPSATLFPYTTLFRSVDAVAHDGVAREGQRAEHGASARKRDLEVLEHGQVVVDRRVLELRSEEHTSELQSPVHLVCRLLLEKKK